MMRLPFFEVGARFYPRIKLRHANGFRIVISSKNSNVISFMSNSFSNNETYQARNFGYIALPDVNSAGGQGYEEDVFYSLDIPFNNMVQEEQNLRKDRFFDHEIIKMTPNEISLYCESPVEAVFDFKVKKISAIYDPNLLDINKVQRK